MGYLFTEGLVLIWARLWYSGGLISGAKDVDDAEHRSALLRPGGPCTTNASVPSHGHGHHWVGSEASRRPAARAQGLFIQSRWLGSVSKACVQGGAPWPRHCPSFCVADGREAGRRRSRFLSDDQGKVLRELQHRNFCSSCHTCFPRGSFSYYRQVFILIMSKNTVTV